ncbi:MAG: NAD-binding protein [Limisphaerales bacterium]
MKDTNPSPEPSTRQRNFPGKKWLLSLWPQGPLAVVLAFIGLLNILDGLSLPLAVFRQIRALNGLSESFSAVGGTAQVILGFLLMVVGTGLWWRLVSAWTLSALLLTIMVGINLAREQWGLSLTLEVVMLCALLLAKRRFTRRTVLAGVIFSLSSIFAILAYGAFGSYLLGTDFHPEIHDLNTAFYFTIVTLSTVGYGDFVPVTPEARWFAISLLVVGLGVFASAIASVLGPKISGELNRLFNPKEKTMEAKNHVILVGEGPIARNTAEELKQRGVNFIQIVAAKPEAETSAHIIEGDATNDDVLRQACIQHARMIIAAREDDGENAFIALGAKDLNPDVRVLAVASSALSIRRLKLARADLVFSPAAVGSRLMADLVKGNEISPAFRDLLEGHLKKV